jgi:purine-cytosine permease-like protein
MELLIAAAFVAGVLVGTFVGTLVIALCAMAGRDERTLDPVLATPAK